jgi:hypothetical protein
MKRLLSLRKILKMLVVRPPPSRRETLAIAISVGGCQQLSRAMHSDEEALVFKYNGDVAADMVK